MTFLENLTGKKTAPASRITSSIVCLILAFSFIFHLVPDRFELPAFGFLAFHLINQLYAYFDDFKIHVCHRCGKALKPTTTYKKHKCKKRK